jgi:tetratricopeptide (TPR) repeat protein
MTSDAADATPGPVSDFETRVPTDDHAGDTPALPSTDPAPAEAPEPESDWPKVPGYRVLGRLGKGGMGVVYKAMQVRAKRVVALKMIQPLGQDAYEFRNRFRREAEAAAKLDHPNIVTVYEVGESDGRLFFSLEYCPGGSLAASLAGRPLPPAEAADLVAKLARAMQHAHEHGIVHRDLKPGNVVLTAAGEPKVADFGLVKRIGGDERSTVDGAVFGSPEYMPPEQARGKHDEVGPAADVYALGAILYDLLTGRPPFKGADTLATLAQVCEREPVPVRHLQPGVPRDLETICLKCLHKAPSRRYASAAELAEDLRRFRAREPILARPVGRVERSFKWARRHPGMAALWAAVVLVTAVAFALVTSAWRRADKDAEEARLAAEREKAARQQAQESAGKERTARLTAEKVSEFFGDMFEVSDPIGFSLSLRSDRENGQPVSAGRMLDRGAARVESELKDQKLVQAALRDILGNVYRSMGRYPDAVSRLEQAVAARRTGLGDDNLDVAASRFHLGWLYQDMGEYDRAEAEYRAALETRRRHLAADDPRVTLTLLHLGWLLAELGDPGGEKYLREAVELRSRRNGDDDRQTAVARVALVGFLIDQGRPREAALPMLRAMEAFGRADGDTPILKSLRAFVAGVALRKAGNAKAALPQLRECLAYARQALPAQHPFLAAALHETALALVNIDPLSEEAEALWRECLTGVRQTVTLAHPRAVGALCGAAELQARLGRPGEGEALFRELLDANARRFKSPHPSRIEPLFAHAQYQLARNQSQAARESAVEALDLCDRVKPPANKDLMERITNLAGTFAGAGENELAGRLTRAAGAVKQSLHP